MRTLKGQFTPKRKMKGQYTPKKRCEENTQTERTNYTFKKVKGQYTTMKKWEGQKVKKCTSRKDKTHLKRRKDNTHAQTKMHTLKKVKGQYTRRKDNTHLRKGDRTIHTHKGQRAPKKVKGQCVRGNPKCTWLGNQSGDYDSAKRKKLTCLEKYMCIRNKKKESDSEDGQRKTRNKENRSPKGNMWSAIPVALLWVIVNLSEGKQGSGPEGDEVL